MLKSAVIRFQHWYYNVNILNKRKRKNTFFWKKKILSLYEKLKSLSINDGLIMLNKVCMLKSAVIRSQHWYYNVTFFKQFLEENDKMNTFF